MSIVAETLELLEWSRLGQHLASFTATSLGRAAAIALPLPSSQTESEILLAQTLEAYGLELGIDQGLDFDGIADYGEALARSQVGGMLSGKELLHIATTLYGMRRLRRHIEAQEACVQLQTLVAQVRTYPELEQEIHHCIDDRGEVTDRASDTLGGIRQQLKSLRDRIQENLQRIMQRQGGALQELVITQRGDRFVLPVKAPQKDQIPGIVHDVSSTGATLYIEPRSIIDLGNQLRQKQRQEQQEIERILLHLSGLVAAVAEDLEYLLAIATALDLAAARARYSLWLEGSPPRFIDPEEPITLRDLRHPLLLWQARKEDGSPVVPISLPIAPAIKVVAITGPNTGGKTVTLKTLGLAVLLAKAGIFVPARAPVELPWFAQVLADIGDEQSLQQSLSTFSGHIRRIGRIIAALAAPGPHLVLLDEVGAGTDPTEGSALAAALLRYLADQGDLTLATTHYGELKALKYQDARFENASVEFDEASLQPTYRLLWGIPGRSNALAIARRLGLRNDIVDRAQEQLGGGQEDLNQVIAALEQQRQQQEQKTQEAQALLTQTERFYGEVSARAKQLQEREESLRQAQEQEVQAALLAAKAEIAQVIRTLQKGQPSAQKAHSATAALETIAQQQKRPPKPVKPPYRPRVGERVRLPHLGQTAEVLSIDGEKLTVRFGIMKTLVAMTEIESLDGQKVAPPPEKTRPVEKPKERERFTVRTSSNTIDLRGERLHEAEPKLERAISDADAAGSQVVWVLHGKGTGRLRSGVQDYLKTHPLVERFEQAPDNEGGAGVTIAYLR